MNFKKMLFCFFMLTVFVLFSSAQNILNAADISSDPNSSGKQVDEVKAIKLFTSMVEGQKNAEETDTPELLILTNELQSGHEEYIKSLLSDPLFIDLTQEELTVIRLGFPLKGDSTEEELKEVREFVKKYSILKKPLQFMLINSKTGEKLFLTDPALDEPVALLKKINSLLPGKYNGQWIDNFKAGKMIAQKTGRYMLINFTGSDWCIWCTKLKQEVFEQEAFKEYAKKKLVLVEVDFPRTKILPQEAVIENNKLAEKFGIRGYPSVVILGADEKLLGTTGYVQGGAEEFLSGLRQMIGD